jgi:hypothetical protein
MFSFGKSRRRSPRRRAYGGGYLSSDRDISTFRPPPGARGIKLPERYRDQDDGSDDEE